MTTLYALAGEERAILDALDMDGGDIEGPNVQEALRAYWCEGEIHRVADMRADLLDDGETPDGEKLAHEEHFERAMSEIGEKVERKVGNYLKLRAEVKSRSNAREQEAKRLLDMARADNNLVKRLDQGLQIAMEMTGRRKVETEHGKAWVQKNGGRRPVVLSEGVTPGDVPEPFRTVVVDFNKKAIHEALEHGTLDFATLGEIGYTLRVK